MYRTIKITAICCLILCARGFALETNIQNMKIKPPSNFSFEEETTTAVDDSTTTSYDNDLKNFPVSRKGRTIFGIPVNDYAYPQIVSLRYYNAHMCGGTILTPILILTAAHCLDLSLSKIPITHAVVSSPQGKFWYPITHYIPHPGYRREVHGTHDIGLILLGQRIANVQRVSLQTAPLAVPHNTVARAYGWGMTEYGVSSEQLRMVQVPVLHPANCQYSYGHSGDWICISASQNNICSGDSGGPLMYGNKQVGVTSFGSGLPGVVPCMSGYPSVFTRVSSYYSWIQQYMLNYP